MSWLIRSFLPLDNVQAEQLAESQDALPNIGSPKSFQAHDPKVEGLASEASPSIWEAAPVLAWRDDSMRRTNDAFSVHLTASGLSLIFSYPLYLSLPAL